MKWLVNIFLLIAAVGVVTGYFGVALLSLLFGLFTQWAKERFEAQEYIYGRHALHKPFYDSSMLSHQPFEPSELDKRECESSKPVL